MHVHLIAIGSVVVYNHVTAMKQWEIHQRRFSAIHPIQPYS